MFCRDVQIQFAVEAGLVCHYYFEPSKAKEHLAGAQKLSNLQIEMTGETRTSFSARASLQFVET